MLQFLSFSSIVAALFRRVDMPGMGSLSRDSVVGSTMGITRLVSDLCEIHLAGLPRTGALREVWKRRLKQKAYGILLSRIFQDMRTSKTASVGSGVSTTPGKNKVLMLSFNLRVCGREEDAQRLEELLAMLDGPGMLQETGAVLDLLVDLAGSVPPSPQLFSRDFFRRTRKVIRQQELTGYEDPELRQLEARARAMVCGEEWTAIDSVHRTMTVMDAPPGTGLSTLRMQGRGPFEGEERFERETRLSLFGALVHSRTSDLDIRLDLPPVPSNAELTGLAIRVPPSVDQSEDEGFQSASNLTPDSQSEPSLTPDLDIWEAVLNYEPSQRRCWERIGCPPGKKEDPYVTEAGRAAFDRLHQIREAEIRLLSGSLSLSLAQPGPQSEADLVKDALNVLIGVASATFSLNQTATGFQVKHGIFISGTSTESVTSLLEELAECGTHYLRLSRFSLQPVFSSSAQKGLIFQAFTAGVRRYLHYYRACVLSTPHTLSLLNIAFLFKKLGRQLSRFIYDWVYSGVFRDVNGEFMIQVDEDYLGCRDRHFWTHGYVLISRDVEECVPVFLQHIANDIYMCGKTVNLLKVCSPMHYICSSELSVPRIAVTFSLQELEEIERDCEIYRGRMERIARHSAISREAKALRTEIARQELIIQVQETAAKTLETIQGRQLSQKLAKEAKKRELFQELKQQMEKEQQRRLAAQQQEDENDFGFAREFRDREKRLQVLEQQLENKARMELIEHYSRLTEEAAAREQRALWKVRRHRLEAARVSFLENDAKEIQAQLEKFLLDRYVKQEDPQDATEQGIKDTACPILDPPHQYSAPFLPKMNVALSHTPSSEDRRSSVDTVDMQDFLPKFSNISSKVDAALADIGSELCEGDVIPQVNYDLHIPCTQVSPTAKLSETMIKQDTGDVVQCETAMQSTALPIDSVNLKAHDDNSKVGENVSDKEEATEILKKLAQEEKITLGKSAGSGPQWQSEQVYLDTMAARYEVDRYQDSYYMMDQLPDSTLLQQVTAARYALPLDPALRRATDATAVQLSELVSLPVLMKHSVTSPLVTHVSLVNKAVVDYYFVELSVESHCEALRHFLLMEDGEFAQSLSDQLFEKLGTGQTPGQLLTPLVLNSILNKALQYSLHGHSQVASKLTFALRFMPDAFHPHAPDVLACLELQYKVDWPLNVVITESCMNKYNRIFSFLLQLKHMVWTLHDVWLHLRRAALVKGAGGSAQFRQLQLYRHEMQHFVKVIQGYIANQILQVSWSEFHQRLASVGNLEDLYRAHADYLNKAVFRGLLTEKATPVMNIIYSIFSLILKFRAQLISQAWQCQQGVAEHPNFGAMHQSYRTFKHYSHFLFKVVTKLVNRGYQPHLEDFLLRINFNSYYRDS
ncbi:GCP6 protein, partial [Polypterus senegalus]